MRTILASTSLLSGIFLFGIYEFRPDWATALTIFPAWSWLLLWLLAAPSARLRIFKVASLVWLIFALGFVEEIRSLSRTLFPESDQAPGLVVATINCSGSMTPLITALDASPDVVLIQETPQKAQMITWLSEYDGYEYAHGIDTGILVKGHIRQIGPKAFFYNSVIAEIENKTYSLTSLRLATSNPRIDLWNLDCWKHQKLKREQQLNQISEVEQQLPESTEALRVIVGGDFNVPQGDRVFQVLGDDYIDSFGGAARGWCNTITSSIPLLRIDQIWTSQNLRSIGARVEKAKQTDHKIYLAEFVAR